MVNQDFQDERREFLAVASKLSLVVAALGLSGSVLADAAVAADKTGLRKLLRYAIDTGDMETAIKEYGAQAGLDGKQKAALQSLTREDLAVLKNLRMKLAPHEDLRGALKLLL